MNAPSAKPLRPRVRSILHIIRIHRRALQKSRSNVGFGELLVEHVLGERYRIDAVLNEGGFGVVFRATDLRAEGEPREVAVKVLKVPDRIRGEARERFRDRFRHEAAYASRLPPHPNVVPIHDYGTYRGGLDYLVMELLEGEDLRARLQRPEPVPLAAALRILRDAARGVAVGHEGGLIHRDVKPANIHLGVDADGSPRVRILDFGIAKLVETDGLDTPTQVTMAGEGLFTEYYAAPEQLRREPVTRAADVYSLGVVGFELLTRTRLFTEDDQIRRKQGLPVEMPSILARTPEVPPEVEAILGRALSPLPADRFADAGAFAAALDVVLARLSALAPAGDATALVPAGTDEIEAGEDATVHLGPPVLARAAGADAATPGEDATSLADAEPERRTRAWVPKGLRVVRRRAVAATAVAVVALAGGAVAASQGGGGVPEALSLRVPDASDAARLNDEGKRLFREGDYVRALERFRRAREIVPASAEYHNNFAYALLRAGRTDDAVAELEAVATQHPKRSLAFWNLAEAYLARADTTNAVIALHRLFTAEPPRARQREAEALLAKLTRAEPVAPETGEWDVVPDSEVWAVPYADGDYPDGDEPPYDGSAATDSVQTVVPTAYAPSSGGEGGRM